MISTFIVISFIRFELSRSKMYIHYSFYNFISLAELWFIIICFSGIWLLFCTSIFLSLFLSKYTMKFRCMLKFHKAFLCNYFNACIYILFPTLKYSINLLFKLIISLLYFITCFVKGYRPWKILDFFIRCTNYY